MILKRAFSIVLLLISVQLHAFQLSKSITKKVQKELVKTFGDKELILETIAITDEVNAKLYQKIKNNTLFKIIQKEQIIGYAYIDKAPSKTDAFDYLIIIDTNLIIKKTKVLIYREDYGGEIGSKRWLKQFIGKSSSDNLKYEREIIAISGATISARSMTIAINTFLKNLFVLKQQHIL